MSDTFRLALGARQRVTSMVVVAGVAIFSILILLVAWQTPEARVPILLALFLAWASIIAFPPRRIVLSDGVFMVRFFGFPTRLKVSDIKEASAYEGPLPVVRLAGSVGFRGSHGLFWSRQTRSVWLAVSDSSKVVRLQVASGRDWLVSPEQTDTFLSALRLQRKLGP